MLKVPVLKMVTSLSLAVLAGGAGLLGYRALQADAAAAVYRDRLLDLASEYESLRSTFNEAVRRTAVTELLVQDGRLSVRVRSAEGVLREVETPYDPSGEIYADYVVVDGRLWIRRVFDANTPPKDGIVIEPSVAHVDWEGEGVQVGKAVYRALGEGRWVVTVTGDGSLGLRRAGDADELPLVSTPEVRDYEEEARRADEYVRSIGPGDVWRRLVGSDRFGAGRVRED